MKIKLFTGEVDALVHLLTQNIWMYHTNQHIKEETVRAAFVEGYYENDRETHWILENEKRVGIILIHDISDTIPLFDIRLYENCREKG